MCVCVWGGGGGGGSVQDLGGKCEMDIIHRDQRN